MHKMLVSVLCLFAAMSASGLSFSAQTALTGTTPAKEESFTLEQYIAKYLAGSPRLQAETNSLKIARNTYKNAFTSAFLPSFYLSANASENYGRNYHYSSWEDFEHGDSYGQAQASWNLFNIGKDTLNYKSASLEWQIAKINYDSTVQQHVLDAVQTYYDLLLSQKLLAVYEDDLAVAQMLFLESEDNERDISLYINSPGGSVTAGLAIYDTIRYLKSDVRTICIGQACSMAAVLLAAGTKGKRYSLPSSRIMIHQPWGGAEGQATDIGIQAKEIVRLKKMLTDYLAADCGQKREKLETDLERDFYLTAGEALEYGLIDKILAKDQ